MLPGIVKIGYFKAASLPNLLLPLHEQLDSFKSVNFLNNKITWIDLADLATLDEEFNQDYFGYDVNTKLEFMSSEILPDDYDLAFLVYNAIDEMFIIGNVPPVCGVLKRTHKINKPNGEPSIYYYSFSIPVKKHKL